MDVHFIETSGKSLYTIHIGLGSFPCTMSLCVQDGSGSSAARSVTSSTLEPPSDDGCSRSSPSTLTSPRASLSTAPVEDVLEHPAPGANERLAPCPLLVDLTNEEQPWYMFEDSQAQFEDFGSMGGQLPLSAFPEQRFESPAMELTLGKLTQEDLLLADVRGSDAGFAEGVPTLPSCGFTTTTGQAPLHDGSEVLPGLKHVPEEQFGDTQLQWSLLQFADTQVELDPMDQPQYGSERISLDEQQWHADQVQNWYGSEVHAGLGLEYMPVLDAPHQDQVQQVYGSEIPLHFGIESHVADTQQFWAPTEPRQCDGPGVPACPYADTQVQGEPSDAVCLDGQDIPCEDVEDSESCSPTEIEPSESSDKAQSPPRDREKAGFFTMRLHVITMQHHFLTIYI